jgi:protein O-mannosyl-transferase
MNLKNTGFLLSIVLLIAVIATYSNHFNNGFHLDDTHAIVNNAYIKSLSNVSLFFKDGTTFSSLPSNQSYRPLLTATLAIDYWQGGGVHNTFFFHLTTFSLFLFQGLLMYFFYLKIFSISFEYRWIHSSAFIALSWYMLHPANAETINYITARSDSLSTMFIVLSFVLFVYSPLCRNWHLYLLPVAAGALTKPIAAIFAPLLFVYILLFEEKMSLCDLLRKEGLKDIGPALKKTLPAFLFSAVLMVFIKEMDPPTWTPGNISGFHYIITQPFVILHYFITFFFPLGLSADTDWRTLDSVIDIRFLIGILFLIILLFAATVSSKSEKTRPIAFGLLWFLITLLPTSLIPLSEVMNDHRIFLPYVGLMMSVCWAATLILFSLKRSFSSGKKFTYISISVILVLIAGNAYGTYQRNKVWKTEETLWRDVTEKSPKNARGLMNYGITLMAKADYARAEKYFTKALHIAPEYPYTFVNMGVLKMATGKLPEAEWNFRRAIVYGPGNPECYFYYAYFLQQQNRTNEAIQNLVKTLRLARAHLGARYLLMAIYFKQSDIDKLKVLAQETLLIVPHDSQTLLYLKGIKNM